MVGNQRESNNITIIQVVNLAELFGRNDINHGIA